MNFGKFFRNSSQDFQRSEKKNSLVKASPLFHYFFFFIGLYIAKQILIYFLAGGYEDKLWLITTPIAIFLAVFCFLVFGSCKMRRIDPAKCKALRFLYWFDFFKTLLYMVLMVTITEFKLLEIVQFEENERSVMFWFSVQISLLVGPTILSLQVKISNIVVLLFHFLYLYIRMEGFRIDNVEASFCFLHIIPLTIYIYRCKVYEQNVHTTKLKQQEEGKFASTVLNLLPEGVAIVDDDGLQYMNNSLRKIMRVRDDECLEALSALENRQFAEESAVSSAFIKKSLSLGKSDDQIKPINARGVAESVKSAFSKPVEDTRVNKPKDEKKKATSSVDSPRLVKRPTKTHGPRRKKFSSFYKNVMEFETNEAINNSGISVTKFIPNKDGSDEGHKRFKDDECYSPYSPAYSDAGLSSSFREDRSPDSPMSSPGVSTLRRKIKKILHKIEEPYQTSHHKTVKEAISDILTKMKEEFSPDAMSGVIMSLFAKMDPALQRRISIGSQYDKKQKPKPKNQSLGPNHWAVVMQSTRQVTENVLQYLEIKFNPIITNGKSALIILVRDVTEKEIIKKMEEKEKSQSLALASVSHEFRTPLNGIMGMLESLKYRISQDLNQNFLVPAFNSAKLLLTLVNDILDFHQIKEKKLVLVPVKFQLRSKLEESLSLISIQAKAKGVQLGVEIDNRVPKIICNDPNRLQQVVNNLLGNAVKFTMEGSINIKVEKYSERRVCIKVIDTGIGIESTDIQKLFKAFGKIDSNQHRELNPQGVGLGLTISNSLAKVFCSNEEISGLNVMSEPHKGSTFWFLLDNLYLPEDEYEVEDDEDDTKNLSANVEDLNRKFYRGADFVSGSVVHIPTSSINTLKEIQSPANVHRNTLITSLAGMSLADSPTRLEIPLELDPLKGEKVERVDRIERIERVQKVERIERAEKVERRDRGNRNMREKILKRTFVMNDNLGRLVEKLKESRQSPPVVLVIDDNEYNHLVLKGFLELFELEVHSAYNGLQGLEKVKQRKSQGLGEQYLMVFIDVEMPVMNGLDCAKALKALMVSGELENIPLIAQTGNSEDESQKCMEAGMIDYLQKPIAKSKLIEMVVKWLPKVDL